MKIYVSGTFTDQARLRTEAAKLTAAGHDVVSTWLHEASKPDNLTYDQWMMQLAVKDVAEVFRSDCIIMDVDNPSTSGGRYTEFGVAAHPQSTCLRFVVGGKPAKDSALPYGCFVHLAHKYFPAWDEVHTYLTGLTAAAKPAGNIIKAA